MNLTNLIDRSKQKLNSSTLPNPLYDQNTYFYPGCVGPIAERSQMMGYLGSFIGFDKLSNEIDICILPNKTLENLSKGKNDDVIKDLQDKLLPKNEKNKRPEVSHESILFLPENKLFSYIKQNLIKKDHVKQGQFNRINFTYELN